MKGISEVVQHDSKEIFRLADAARRSISWNPTHCKTNRVQDEGIVVQRQSANLDMTRRYLNLTEIDFQETLIDPRNFPSGGESIL